MQDIGRLVVDIQKGVELALGKDAGLRTIFTDPDALRKLIVSGELRRQASERKHGCPVPQFCIFSVTWKCNLACDGCYATNYTSGTEMSLETIERVLRECIDLGSYNFIIVGGEPLMVPGLIETLASLTGGMFFLFTNGTLLDESHVEALCKAPNVLPILSTEGGDEYTDDRRGDGVGEKLRGAMALLRARHLAFGISAMVSPKNLAQVTSRQWFDCIWDLGVRFAFLIDYVSCSGKPDKSLTLSDREMALKKAALDARWSEARPLAINFPVDEYSDDAPCQAAGGGMMHINADGYVEPCPFSHYAVDNVMEKSVVEILGGEFFTRIRDQFCSLPNPSQSCLLSQYVPQVAALAAEMGGRCTEHKTNGGLDG
jgi:MoaA/NifB/PqqE/SkfB family radical SAM enzyme